MMEKIFKILTCTLLLSITTYSKSSINITPIPYSLEQDKILQLLSEVSIGEEPSRTDKLKNNILELKDLDGNLREFSIIETPVLPNGLADRFPMIKTYSGNCLSNPSEKISITRYKNSLSLSMHLKDGLINITKQKNEKDYFAFVDTLLDLEKFNCQTILSETEGITTSCIGGDLPCYPIGDSLYIFRIGMILSKGANASVADGTVGGGLAWIADMINRCNLVWIRDLGSKLILADSSHLLICTEDNKGYFPSQPFDQPTHFLLQYINPMLDDILGANNYEYGHLVTTGVGGGWAALNSQRGVSDPNYEVIIHEIGHQLGSAHNLVIESADNAWSIGGTIMGSRDNTVKNNEGIRFGDQYSSHTIDIAIDNQRRYKNSFQNGWHHESSGNSIPVITEIHKDGFTIPIGTPFMLEGKAEDPDDDILTYTWEQNDKSNVSFLVPDYPVDSGPLFVTIFPSISGAKRYFPNMNDLLENVFTYKEQLPFSSRELNFRFVVRDNNPNCGSYTYKNVRFNSDQSSGPFKILTANNGEIYTAGSEIKIEWDVANTNQTPVNCQKVTILLSKNGGVSFNYVLAEDIPNNGEVMVTLPNLPGANNRLMIKAADNIFFDLNDAPFTLHDPQTPGLFISLNKEEIKVLEEDSVEVLITTRGLGPLTGDLITKIISRPEIVDCYFSNQDTAITTNLTSEMSLIVNNLTQLGKGNYSIRLEFLSGDITEEREIKIQKTGEVFITPGKCINIPNGKQQNIILPKFDIVSNNFSFMAWIKPNGMQNPYSSIFCLESDNTAALNFKENNELGYHWEGGSWSWNSGLYAKENEWSHVALVVKQNSIVLYLNGKQAVHPVDAEKINFNNIVRLGSYKNWIDRNYYGAIDEVSFWNKSLEKEEILEQFHKTLNGNEDGLLAYYQLDRKSVADAIGENSGYSSSGSLDYIPAFEPLGESVVSVNREKLGLVFYPEVGVSVNYTTQNAFEVVIVKLNVEPNTYLGIDESLEILKEQYWVYHRYSNGGIYVGDIAFQVADIHTRSEYDLPEHYQLFNRSEGSDEEWKYLKDATGIDKISNTITFEKIFATGQFLIVKKGNVSGLHDNINVPKKYRLSQNYPNPFNPETTINFELPKNTRLKIEVYDILGNFIKVLVNKDYSQGYHKIVWDGTNVKGEKVVSGLYFYKFNSVAYKEVKKMILLK